MENDIYKFQESLTKIKLTKKNLQKVPTEPGIYIFWKESKIPQYVGKSISLKNRLLSYLTLPLQSKTLEMIKSSDSFSFVRVGSELESLLLEAKLIRLLMPKYNIELKDDKNPLYIKITKDKFPQILTARRKETSENKLSFYGPFPSSAIVKKVLKILRRIIPYSTHLPQKRPCIYSQIGLCNPCPSLITNENNQNIRMSLTNNYLKNIRLIKNILDGKITSVNNILNKEMKKYAEYLDFEKAEEIKKQLQYLEYITQSVQKPSNFIKNPNLLLDIRNQEKEELEHIICHYFGRKDITRIECYDIAHLVGTNPAASMVTFINGENNKNYYRRFKIMPKYGGNDVGSLLEVAKRRLNHLNDWGVPDLMIIDGGKGQVDAFKSVFNEMDIPIIGLAKRFETLVIPVRNELGENFEIIRLKNGPLLNLVQRIRNEAHRFAQSYHHKLVREQFIAE